MMRITQLLLLVAGLLAGFLLGSMRSVRVAHEAAPTAIPAPVVKSASVARGTSTPAFSSRAWVPASRVALPEFQDALGKIWNYSDGEAGTLVEWIDQLDEQDLSAAVTLVLKTHPGDQQKQCLVALFKRLARKDPVAALKIAQTNLNLLQGEVWESVFSVGLASQPEAVITWLKAQPADQTREYMLRIVASKWVESSPEATLDLIQELSPNLVKDYMCPIFSCWVKTDPVVALARMIALPDRQQIALFFPTVIAEWAHRDMSSAEAWVGTLPKGSEQRAAAKGILMALARKNPARAVARALELTVPQDQITVVQSVLEEWSRNDMDSALAWVRQLPEGALRKAAQETIMPLWAARDPSSVADYVSSLPTAEQEDGLMTLVDQWARQDGQAAAKYVMALQAGDRRVSAISRFMDAWMEVDASAAVAWIKNLPPGADRQEVFKASLNRFAQEDPETASAWVDRMPISPARDDAIGTLFYTWVDDDPEKALEWVKTLPTGEDRNNACRNLLSYSAWIQQCPTQALALFMNLPTGDTRNSGLASCVKTWANLDFEGAREWVMRGDDQTLKSTVLPTLMEKWVQLDPEQAVRYAHDQKCDNLSLLVQRWTDNDPAAAIGWVTKLPLDEMKQRLPEAIRAWARQNPVEAAKYLAQLPPGNVQDESAVRVVAEWASQDVEKAARWAGRFPREELRCHTWPTVAGAWAPRDPDGAVAWVQGLPAGKPRDLAIQVVVSSLQQYDPRAAIQLAGTVGVVNLRDPLLEQVAMQWLQTDAEPARLWIGNSGLSGEVKTRLLKMVP